MGLDRDALDAFSARSHRLSAEASDRGDFVSEIVPVGGVLRDETIRATRPSKGSAGLNPAFRTDELAARFPQLDWRITAGNSSPLTDGASAVLLMSAERAAALKLTPRARFLSFAVTGSDPILMLTGVIPATRKVLERASLTIDDMDAYEVNEAFASVPLAWQHDLDADPDKLNPWGGAIALGHALGSSGHPAARDPRQLPRVQRRPLWPADHVRGRRDGQRHRDREDVTVEISGCSALVTGGASGLGLATALALRDAGANVVIVDLPGSHGEDRQRRHLLRRGCHRRVAGAGRG